MSRILIAGCGYVGGELALQLAREGETVFGLRRDPTALSAEVRAAGVEAVAADLLEPAACSALPEDLDAVVYALAPGRPGADGSRQSYEDVYLRALENLLALLRETSPALRRLLFVSSTSVYAQDDSSWVDEDSATEPARETGRTLLRAEAVARAAEEGAPLRSVVLRLGGIYGPGRTRLLSSIVAGSARRRAGLHFTNRIHRDDAAGLAAHLLAHPDPAPLYLGVDCEPVCEEELYAWMARELGASLPPLAASDDAVTRSRAGSKRCRNARALASGYAFRFPDYRAGYAPLIAAHRAA